MTDIYDTMVVLDNLKRIVTLEKTKENLVIAYDSLDNKSDNILSSGDVINKKYRNLNNIDVDANPVEESMDGIETLIRKVDKEIELLKQENFKITGEDHQQLMSKLSDKSREYVTSIQEEPKRSTL